MNVHKEEASFCECIIIAESIFMKCSNNSKTINNLKKLNYVFCTYFMDEDVYNIFEGFLRLLIEIQEFGDKSNRQLTKLFTVQCFLMFYNFLQKCSPNKETILRSLPKDRSIYVIIFI